MKKKSIMRALTSTLLAATSAKLVLNAQTAQPYKGVVGRTLAESKEWWPEPVKAPDGAPNVIWILLDDVGYGASSTFGGLISTPTFDYLAANGLRYTNFHTCAICAPVSSRGRVNGLAAFARGARSCLATVMGRRAAGPSPEGMPKVRRFAESQAVRDFVHVELGGAQIFFGKIAADVIENLREGCALGLKPAV